MKSVIVLLILLGCANKKNNTDPENLGLNIPKILVEKQFTYAVSVGVFTSYELYINDIAAEKDYDPGSQAAI